MVQMLAGLITYILLAIYCHDEHQEPVSVLRLRGICFKIRNEEVSLILSMPRTSGSINHSAQESLMQTPNRTLLMSPWPYRLGICHLAIDSVHKRNERGRHRLRAGIPGPGTDR